MNKKLCIGAADVYEVVETTFKMPFAMFGLNDNFVAENRHWLCPTYLDSNNEWDNVIRSWVLIVDDKVVVIDPCTGNGRDFPDFPLAHMLETPYIERFEATGFKPEDVDYVFCTHLHMDHCGWNTHLRDGRYVPTFPNARYVMVRREYQRWDPGLPGHVAVKANAGAFENSVLPVLQAGQIQLVPDNFRI